MNSTNLSKQAKAEKAKREKARRHLADFARYVYDGYKTNWHTNLICDALQRLYSGEIRYLIIEAPPRHSKSLHVSQLFPAWAVGKDKDKSIIVSSYSGDLATDHGRETRKLMEDKKYQNIFETRLAHDSNAKGKWNTQGKGAYNAVGVGGSITGKGADFFIADDTIKDRKEADSSVMRDNVWRFFTAVATTRLSPQGAMCVMQTRWHIDDIIGRLTENTSEYKEPWVDYFDFIKNGLGNAKWVRLRLTAIAEQDEEYRKEGEALWADHFSLEELMSKKATLGGYEFSSLYQQNPIDEENRVFKPEWFKYKDYAQIKDTNTRNYLTIDTKATDAKEGGTDYVGYTINFVDQHNNWHFISKRVKFSSKELVDFCFNAHTTYNLDSIGLEKTAFTEGLQPYFEEEMRRRNHFLPLVELSHRQTRKIQRIEQGLSPRYERGAIFHLTIGNQNQCADLEEELLTFPGAKNDDASDSAAYQGDVAEPSTEDEEEIGIY